MVSTTREEVRPIILRVLYLFQDIVKLLYDIKLVAPCRSLVYRVIFMFDLRNF